MIHEAEAEAEARLLVISRKGEQDSWNRLHYASNLMLRLHGGCVTHGPFGSPPDARHRPPGVRPPVFPYSLRLLETQATHATGAICSALFLLGTVAQCRRSRQARATPMRTELAIPMRTRCVRAEGARASRTVASPVLPDVPRTSKSASRLSTFSRHGNGVERRFTIRVYSNYSPSQSHRSRAALPFAESQESQSSTPPRACVSH